MVEVSTHCSEGSPSYPDKPDTQLFMDASNIGWGAHWNALTLSGVWITTEKTLHINVLKLEAIHRAMLHWLMGLTVLVASENATIVSYINKQGWTRSIQLCRRTKKLLLMCQANLIVLRARHIPGRLNVLADILLRLSQMSGTEWSLHPSVFRALTREWGIPLLDLFATRWNHKCLLFVSAVPDPSAMTVVTLSMSWNALWANAQPPPALLPRVLEKAQQDQYELILIAPHWPQAIWFPLLLGMLVQSPLRISNIPRLLFQLWGQIHRDTSNTLCSRDLSVDVASSVSRPQLESTLAVYESKWRTFTAWCNIQHINPLSTTESVVSDFLLNLHTENNLAISTIAGYQMAIANTLRATSGAEVGRNPALKSLLRNIEMERAPSTSFPE